MAKNPTRKVRAVVAIWVVGATAALFFCPSKVALSAAEDSSGVITQNDLDQLASDQIITVVGPSDATPESLVQTILGDPTLSEAVRAPFVELMRSRSKGHTFAVIPEVPDPR